MSKLPEGFNPEQKEEEKSPSLLIIYRENDFLKEHAPEMSRMLQEFGREANCQAFPEEATDDEIKNWYKEHKDEIKNAEIISDYTAGMPYDMKEEFKAQGVKAGNNIDLLFDKITENAIFGELAKELRKSEGGGEWIAIESPENSKRWFSAVIKKILENPENMPEKVHIFLDNILDHTKLFNYQKVMEIKEKSKDVREESEKSVAENLKEWLAEGGIANNKTITNPEIIDWVGSSGERHLSEIGENLVKEADKPENWVIIDRHAGLDKFFKSAKNLKLPEDSFYDSARRMGLLKVKTEEFNKAMEDVLRNMFENKKE